MILSNQLEVEEEEIIGDSERISASIDVSNLPFVFDLVSSRLYSNPIGSIVRELTSNCYDAHIEAGVNEPVIINFDLDHETDIWYVEFIDKGVGMNPERFKKYMQWFTSTKRDSNDQIGAFGIGSKSGLAYSDYYRLTTISEGYEYRYIINKTSNGPISDTLSPPIITGKGNGTTVRIDLKSISDRQNFINAVKEQLPYFDNVFIKGVYSSDGVQNEYRLYESETYKFRSGYIPYKTMHILIGKVIYPIDWTRLSIPIVEIPVGLKFNIGELSVTPSRENIEYREGTKELITERINACVTELKQQFEEQNPLVDDLREYFQRKDEKPGLTFGGRDKLMLDGLDLRTKTVFRPLMSLPKIPDQLFFEYYIVQVQNGKEKLNVNYDYARNYEMMKVLPRAYFSKQLTKYNNISLGSGNVVMPWNNNFKTCSSMLGYQGYKGGDRWTSWYLRVSNQAMAKRPILGAAQGVKLFREVIKNYILSNSQVYPNVSEDWIKNYKKQLNEESEATRRRREQIILYINRSSNRNQIKTQYLEASKYVFYAIKDESASENMLWEAEDLVEKEYGKVFPNHYTGEYHKKIGIPLYKFIMLNNTNFKLVQHLPNLIHIRHFYTTKELQPFFNKTYLAYLWSPVIYEWGQYNLHTVSSYHHNLLKVLRQFKEEYRQDLRPKTIEFLKNIPVKNHPCTWKYRKIKKELDAFMPKVEILRYISFNIPDKHLRTIVKSLHTTKLNSNLYGNNSVKASRTESNSDN